LDKFKIKNIHILAIALFLILAEAFILFGKVGFLALGGIFLLFLLPAYLILHFFNIGQDEKIFFAFFISIGIFPLIVWLINRVIPSLRVSLVITFILLVLIGITLNYYKKNKKKRKSLPSEDKN
jgi:hypothetical protein